MDKSKMKSLMWLHFEKLNDGTIVCNYCSGQFKYSKNTSNMKDHIKRKHPEKLQAQSTSNNESTSENFEIELENPNSSIEYYSVNSTRKKRLDTLFTLMVARDMEPLRLSEREGLKEFVAALDIKYQMPSRCIITNKLLPKLHATEKLKLKEILHNVENIALTTDMWTSKNNQGMCAVTCHFILNQKLEAAFLDIIVMEERHTADNIAEILDRIFKEWNIHGKIVALVTDNASTMIKVATILKIRHMPCFAHSLNLVIKEVLNHPNVKELIDKCSAIVTHFKRSTLASDKLKSIQREMKKAELKLVRHIEVRWNSAYYMIQRLLVVREEITLALNQLLNAPPNLTADEYNFLNELEKLLDVFDTCTSAISGEQYVTISLIIPLLKGLSLKMVEFENSNFTEAAQNIIKQMKTSINDKLMKPYESRSACIIATLLNPQFKKVGFKTDTDVERATTYVQKEYSSYLASRQNMRVMSQSDTTCESSLEDNSGPSKKSKLDSLLSFVDTYQNKDIRSATADAIIDLRQYLEKPLLSKMEYPLDYWTYNENNLKYVALKYLCIPGSSTPAERIFSKAGQIITERRSRLSGKHVNALLFLNVNYDLLKSKK